MHNRHNFMEIRLWREDTGADSGHFFREMPIGTLIINSGIHFIVQEDTQLGFCDIWIKPVVIP
jgi:hypothetical protein